ncbi:hypothetical protein Pcinc_023581 [Petrolisthes cinctipes]|uniref:Uncharacterized protein n=1 Tax=Petrolisthes cinctipes TaxID=88211 RepID=A0AAE1KC11_PETCI|nr:hypothetical protein Pcinc_023581 [Petrolisthes cinctipes]
MMMEGLRSLADLGGKWLDGNRSVVLGAGAVVAVLLARKIIASKKKQKLRREWDSVGQDVVLLHQFVRGKHCPNLSPFALKVETFLRLANIKYEVDSKSPYGPKGKCPWITINGEDVADSEFVLDNLTQRFNINLESHLSTQQVASLEAVRVLADEHLFWCVITWRYWLDRCVTFLTTQDLGLFFNTFIPVFMVPGIKHRSREQGIGLHSPEEIYQICKKDCATLAGVLGDNDFFGGEKPSRADCAVFGQLAQLMWNAPGTRYEALLTDVFPCLASYCLRMKDTEITRFNLTNTALL